MHVEPSQHAPQSLKEFGIHYLMIVVGILTAVGIEQGIEALHHRELASQAREQIDEELRGDLRETSEVLADNRHRLAALQANEAALINDVRQNDATLATFDTRLKAVAIGVATPALRRDAWDTAIADQALSYVDAATVRRYSSAYSAQRDTTATILATFTMGDWSSALKSVSVDAKLGKVDQVGLLKALSSYEVALVSTAENERELEEALKASVDVPAAAPVTSGASR